MMQLFKDWQRFEILKIEWCGLINIVILRLKWE
jgi:hypothetical protein